MRQVVTWLNEEEYKRFIKHMERIKSNPYKFMKQYILASMESPEQYRAKMRVLYYYVLYSLFATVVVLVF